MLDQFGGGRVGRVDIDFLSGPEKTGTFASPQRARRGEEALRLESALPLVRPLTRSRSDAPDLV